MLRRVKMKKLRILICVLAILLGLAGIASASRPEQRMFENLPVIRTIARWLFVSQLGRWLFFKNMFTHSLINRIWYRKMVRD